MTVEIELEPAGPRPPAVEYRWDADTDILSARLQSPALPAETRTLELAGADGSWLMLDVVHDRLHGVDVAVWPDVRRRAELVPPAVSATARAVVRRPARSAASAMRAESDAEARTVHFRLGGAPVAAVVRVGGDLLVEVDARSRLAGLWLLNVPPAPDA